MLTKNITAYAAQVFEDLNILYETSLKKNIWQQVSNGLAELSYSDIIKLCGVLAGIALGWHIMFNVGLTGCVAALGYQLKEVAVLGKDNTSIIQELAIAIKELGEIDTKVADAIIKALNALGSTVTHSVDTALKSAPLLTTMLRADKDLKVDVDSVKAKLDILIDLLTTKKILENKDAFTN